MPAHHLPPKWGITGLQPGQRAIRVEYFEQISRRKDSESVRIRGGGECPKLQVLWKPFCKQELRNERCHVTTRQRAFRVEGQQ